MAANSVVLYAAILLLHWTGTAHQGVDAQEDNIPPYLLFTSRNFIYQVYANGTGRELVHEANGDIFAVDYHHRMDYLFWSNTKEHSIRRAHLNGSHIATIATNVSYPADLAVDWINNKLYWTDRDYKQIEVYDLMTSERRVVVTTGPSSLPLGLAVYPYPGYGWLYWTDRGKQAIERVAITGEARQTVYNNPNSCLWPITLDYSTHTIYWMDYCRFRIESIDMDGSMGTRSLLVTDVFFSYGISLFEDTIYWTQQTRLFSVDRVRGEPIIEIYSVGSNFSPLGGVEAVHLTKQPEAEEFVMLTNSGESTCDPACVNGSCIDPGLCACHQGWTGLDCSLDINECERSNGGCDHLCTNLAGSYNCSCNEGYMLQSNNRTCEDINECESNNGGCYHVCLNYEGSYNCSCLEGFLLHTDNRTCLDATLINDTTTSPVHESTTVLQHDVTSSSAKQSHTLMAAATPLVSPPLSVETSSSLPLPTPTFHSSITQATHPPLPPSEPTSHLVQQTAIESIPSSSIHQSIHTSAPVLRPSEPQTSVMSITLPYFTTASSPQPTPSTTLSLSDTIRHSTIHASSSIHSTMAFHLLPSSSEATTLQHGPYDRGPTHSDSIAIASASIPAQTPTTIEVRITADGQTTPTSPPAGETKSQIETEIIIIAAIVSLGSVLLIGMAVGYAILAYCKYRYRTAKWIPPGETPDSLAESGSPVSQFSKTEKQ